MRICLIDRSLGWRAHWARVCVWSCGFWILLVSQQKCDLLASVAVFLALVKLSTHTQHHTPPTANIRVAHVSQLFPSLDTISLPCSYKGTDDHVSSKRFDSVEIHWGLWGGFWEATHTQTHGERVNVYMNVCVCVFKCAWCACVIVVSFEFIKKNQCIRFRTWVHFPFTDLV